jgi:phosphate transport system permease protein
MQPPQVSNQTVTPNELAQKKKFNFNRTFRLRLTDTLFRWFCLVSAIVLCVVLFSIVFFMGKTGLITFNFVSVTDYFFSLDWVPENEQYGAGVFFLGTIALTLLTLFISVPFSIAIAVFIAEIAPNKLKEAIRPVLDLLVGIPSVIYGFLGLTILVPFIRDVTGSTMGDGLLAAALVLSLMVLPTISRISDDSIVAVPQKYREASYALGCTKLQTILFVVLPAARRGIVSAIILGMTRALGETMAVVMVLGNVPQLASNLIEPTSVLTSNIVMQITNVPFDSTWNYALYMMGFMLLVIALLLIIFVRIINSRGEAK